MYKMAIVAQALLFGVAGNAATLQPLDLDGDTTTIEAYYHPSADVSWLADTNLGLTETFGLTRGPITDFGTTIDSTGAMLEDALELYIAGMNQAVYLGYSAWRLPISPETDDLTCSNQVGDIPPIITWGTGCEAPEAGAMYQLILNDYGSVAQSPFTSLDEIKRWLGSFGPAGRHFFRFSSEGSDAELQFCGVGRCTAGHVWPVHAGKIGVEILECIDTDGDGWGWDGVNSCRTAEPILPGECIDYDGDGWGWNGVESCAVTTQQCIDSDEDGWGWTGTESCRTDAPIVRGECVDLDGDGWGWDGLETCIVSD